MVKDAWNLVAANRGRVLMIKSRGSRERTEIAPRPCMSSHATCDRPDNHVPRAMLLSSRYGLSQLELRRWYGTSEALVTR